jgi:hypothetical protein
VAIAIAVSINGADADFIAHVENTQLLDGDGKPLPRVLRDAEGNVQRLRLSGMQLSEGEFAAIGRIKTLRFLDLYRTNVTDANLRQLRELSRVEGLNLTATEVTDAAVDELMKFESLRTLCLGNVAVTPRRSRGSGTFSHAGTATVAGLFAAKVGHASGLSPTCLSCADHASGRHHNSRPTGGLIFWWPRPGLIPREPFV